MKARTVGALSLLATAMSLTPAWAGPAGIQRSLSPDQATATAKLETKREEVSRAMLQPNAKGPLLVRCMDRYSQLNDLINRVQNGQPVAPDEIDQALQPANR